MDEKVPRDLILACVHLAQQVSEEDERVDSRKAKEKKKTLQALLSLQDQPDVSWGDNMADLLWSLYASSPLQSKARQYIVQMLLGWAQRRDLPFYSAVEAAYQLYRMSPKGSEERQQAAQMLLTQARWPTVTMKQSVEAVVALSQVCPLRSKEREEGIEVLSALAQRPDLSVEDAWVFITLDFDFAPISIIETTPVLKRRQLALRKDLLNALAQRSDLTSEQAMHIAQALSVFSDPQRPHGYHTTR